MSGTTSIRRLSDGGLPDARGVGVAVAVLIAATVATFSGVVDNAFVNWDDYQVVVDNDHYRGFTAEHLTWMFTTSHAGHYQPLTWLSYAVDHAVWGGVSPVGVHLTNVALHIAAAVLFFLICRRVLSVALPFDRGRDPTVSDNAVTIGALAAALLFAVHPLRVESVAWATERRDVLSGALLMATVLLYLLAVGHKDARVWRRSMFFAWLCYVASLFSKAAGVPLPAVLLVLDVYPLRRVGAEDQGWLTRETRGVWLEKLAFLVPAVVFATVAVWAQADAGAIRSLEEHSIIERIGQALFGLAFYLYKTVWPVGLVPLYEWPVGASAIGVRVLISVAVVAAVTAIAWRLRRRCPALLAAWIVYIAMASPVLGVAQSGPQIAADRYSYLPCTGWAAAVGAVVCAILRRRRSPRPAIGLSAAISVIVLALIIVTRSQVAVWRDSITLWSHLLEYDPDNAKGYSGIGGALRRRAADTGDLNLIKEAGEFYEEAIRRRPGFLSPHIGAGLCATDLGDFDAAYRHYNNALRIKPDKLDALRGMVGVLSHLQKLDEADELYGWIFELDPDARDIRYEYGRLLARQGRFDEAVQQFEHVIRIDPDVIDATLIDAYYGLGSALDSLGDPGGAVDVLSAGLDKDPASIRLNAKLAWVLATTSNDNIRDPNRALHYARRAVVLSESRSVIADEALAAACAAWGDFDKAVATLDARLSEQRNAYVRGEPLRR